MTRPHPEILRLRERIVETERAVLQAEKKLTQEQDAGLDTRNQQAGLERAQQTLADLRNRLADEEDSFAEE